MFLELRARTQLPRAAESWRICRVKAKKDLFIKAMVLAQK
jgi:hypothetical protein